MELVILICLTLFAYSYRHSATASVDGAFKFIQNGATNVYEQYAPYSFKQVREKTKELGQEFTFRQYIGQILMFGGIAAGISYLYFYNLFITVIYVVLTIAFIPYLSYLRTQRLYSEYIFEQIQTYTTNVIMEFNTTQSFVKSLEGVVESGILEDPVKKDVQVMIDMSYANGAIEQSIAYFNEKYPYYMVKNMHQLFYQITKEGARDAGQSLENMSLDIDALVESVYRDRMDRQQFHKKFLTFGMALFLLAGIMQILLGRDSYLKLLNMWYVKLILHLIIIINCYFLLTGEKYYNEDVGVE